jgi:hypothetical protein
MDSLQHGSAGVEPITGLCRFRDKFYSCLGLRADAQFELTDALLCADGPVRSLRRSGHGQQSHRQRFRMSRGRPEPC